MSDKLCPNCHLKIDVNSHFCSECGLNLSATRNCISCGASVNSTMKFCDECGESLTAQQVKEDGFVKDGHWHKGSGEIARFVSLDEMQKQMQFMGIGRSSIEIPPNCIALVIENGKVTEVLPPGKKTTEGWVESFLGKVKELFSGSTNPSNVWLLDQRDIPIAFKFERPKNNLRETIQVLCQLRINGSLQKPESYQNFYNQILSQRQNLSLKDMQSMFRTTLEKKVQNAIPADVEIGWGHIEESIQQSMKEQFLSYGLSVNLSIAPKGSIGSLSFHLGKAIIPNKRRCVDADNVGCTAEIASGEMFCMDCGCPQPAETTPNRSCTKCGYIVPQGSSFCEECGTGFTEQRGELLNLISKDNQRLEFDIVLNYQGQGKQNIDQEKIEEAIASACAQAVRQYTFEELQTASGLKKIDEHLKKAAKDILASLGFRLLDITAIDIRSKDGEWLNNARADMERFKNNISLNKEWLGLREDEIGLQHQVLDLQELSNQLAIRRIKSKNDFIIEKTQYILDFQFQQMIQKEDHEFRVLNQSQENEFRIKEAQQGHESRTERSLLSHEFTLEELRRKHGDSLEEFHLSMDEQREMRAQERQFQMEEREVAYRERRQDHLNRTSTMDIADAKRNQETTTQVDEADRGLRDTLRDRDHAERMKVHGQDTEYEKTITETERDRERDERQYKDQTETEVFDHQARMETKTIQHDSNIAQMGRDEQAKETDFIRSEQGKQNQFAREENISDAQNDASLQDIERESALKNAQQDSTINKMGVDDKSYAAKANIDNQMYGEEKDEDLRQRKLSYDEEQRINALKTEHELAQEAADKDVARNEQMLNSQHQRDLDMSKQDHAQRVEMEGNYEQRSAQELAKEGSFAERAAAEQAKLDAKLASKNAFWESAHKVREAEINSDERFAKKEAELARERQQEADERRIEENERLQRERDREREEARIREEKEREERRYREELEERRRREEREERKDDKAEMMDMMKHFMNTQAQTNSQAFNAMAGQQQQVNQANQQATKIAQDMATQSIQAQSQNMQAMAQSTAASNREVLRAHSESNQATREASLHSMDAMTNVAGARASNVAAFGNQAPPPGPTTPPPRPNSSISAVTYHYNNESGLSAEDVAKRVAANPSGQHMVWTAGFADWQNWNQVPDIAKHVSPPQAPPRQPLQTPSTPPPQTPPSDAPRSLAAESQMVECMGKETKGCTALLPVGKKFCAQCGTKQ